MIRKNKVWHQYTGVIHIHTNASDGTRPLDEVIAFGRELGLDFMMFCDHMTLKPKQDGGEKYYGKMLVAIGYEHNDSNDKNHLLIFDAPRVYDRNLSAAEYSAAAQRDGALTIIAHPDEVRHRLKEYPAYPWTDWEVDDFDGVELWNQMSEWMERLTPFNRLAMALSPRKSLVAPCARTLKRWDEINQRRRCLGMAGVDAHRDGATPTRESHTPCARGDRA